MSYFICIDIIHCHDGWMPTASAVKMDLSPRGCFIRQNLQGVSIIRSIFLTRPHRTVHPCPQFLIPVDGVVIYNGGGLKIKKKK